MGLSPTVSCWGKERAPARAGNLSPRRRGHMAVTLENEAWTVVVSGRQGHAPFSQTDPHRARRRLPLTCSMTGTFRCVIRRGQWNCLDRPSTQTWLMCAWPCFCCFLSYPDCLERDLSVCRSSAGWSTLQHHHGLSHLLNTRPDVVTHACLKCFRLGLAFHIPNTFLSSPCALGLGCIFKPFFCILQCLALGLRYPNYLPFTQTSLFFSGPLTYFKPHSCLFSFKVSSRWCPPDEGSSVGFAFTALGMLCY